MATITASWIVSWEFRSAATRPGGPVKIPIGCERVRRERVLRSVANQITNNRVPGSIPLRMSNGLTAVFFDVLVLAGSDLARTPWEKKLVYWLVQHDPARSGLGVLGFDVAAMGWTRDNFEREKRFVLSIIDAAHRRHGWDRLPFSPRERDLFDALERLRGFVEEFSPDALDQLPDGTWIPDELPDERLCKAHRVYLHETGCIVCNDTPLDVPVGAAPNRSPETT